MTVDKILRKLVLASAIATVSAFAQTPYDEGQKALREQRWMEASHHFEQAAEATGSGQTEVAAAMYWRAHALYKAGHQGDAARQVLELERKHPESHWLAEARALQIEHQGSIDDATAEDELRLFALSQLLERDFDRALPLVMDILRNSASGDVRQDALFILGMSDSPEAQRLIAEAARDSSNPELQVNAVLMLAMAGSDTSLELLQGLYTESAKREIKQAVLHAYLNAQTPGPLVEILRWETDPEMQRDLIYALGTMEATSELHELYPKLNSSETRMAAVEAFAIAGDGEMLRQVLETETDPELRMMAIQGLAIQGGDDSSELIRAQYAKATSNEEKFMVLEAMAIHGGAADLALQVVRTETDPELQQMAIQILGVSGSTTELAELYDSVTDVETRMMILQSMAIAGDTRSIRKALETEQNPEIKVAAIHAIAIGKDDDSAQFLAGLYSGGTPEEKSAVIQSMMILDNAGGLISLIRQENDPSLKREMMEMLSVMDSEEADEFLFEMLENRG
jgi:HEAT repeat protein